jgi:hypothetical protein
MRTTTRRFRSTASLLAIGLIAAVLAVALPSTPHVASPRSVGAAELLRAAAPSAPRTPTARAGNGKAIVSWAAPASVNGSPIYAYLVWPYSGGKQLRAREFFSKKTSEVVTNLANGRSYTFRVAARNAVGIGPKSAATLGIWTRWYPSRGATWQWQLTTPVNTAVKVGVYDIDMFDNSAAVVQRLHQLGHKVICYVDVGSWEDFRPDEAKFPLSVRGATLDGFSNERWLDIRQISVLAPIIKARFTACKNKGFDAVEPDNVDGYENPTGFPLTAADQLRYNSWIAKLARSMGLGVALKNDTDQVSQLVTTFDFELDEQCYEYMECDTLSPFIRAGKAVFEVEYNDDPAQFCPTTDALGFSAMKKNLDLDAFREACP